MNPYKILDIERGAEKQDIIRAAARAMREKKYSVREIASAQKALMNPVSNAACEFLNSIEVKTLQYRLDISQPKALKKSCLEYRPIQGKES